MTLQCFKKEEQDFVDAEIVSGPGAASQRSGSNNSGSSHGQDNTQYTRQATASGLAGIFQRIKGIFVTAALLVAGGMIILGLILTSTVIGAIFGIPLLILGGAILFGLFKFLTLGKKNGGQIFVRRWP